jgi:hypothetical protein
MKITERFRGIDTNQTAENAKPIQPDKFEKKDGPKSTNLHLPIFSEDVFENLPDRPGLDQADEIFGSLRGFLNEARSSSTPQISSRVEKYKGPDSIELPKIESKVDRYTGPDFIERPRPESKVEDYKGPKTLPEEPKIESRVDHYKGPDSLNRGSFEIPADVFDNLPSLPGPEDADILGFVRRLVDQATDSSDSNKSQIESRVDHYRGPDSIELRTDSSSKKSSGSSRSRI